MRSRILIVLLTLMICIIAGCQKNEKMDEDLLTVTSKSTATMAPEPTATPTPEPTSTPTPELSATSTPEPTSTPTPEPTSTPTPESTSTPTPEPTSTPTPEPTATPTPKSVEVTDSMFIYHENGDGTVTLDGFSEEGKSVDWRGQILVIPEKINGKTITHIADYAFATDFWGSGWGLNCDELVIESVTTIGELAFWGSEVQRVALPEGVESIGPSAFFSCYSLKNISLPDSLKEICHMAFSGCSSLQMIELPESLEYMGIEVFSGTNIIEITLPSGFSQSITVEAFMDKRDISNAFAGMEKLQAIYVEAGNVNYMSVDGILYTSDGEFLVYVPNDAPNIEEFIVGDDIKGVGWWAFEGNKKIRKIVIPASLNDSYLSSQLESCSNLSEIIIE